MRRLKGPTCYLCGPMDRVPDGGTEWREHISKRLKNWGIGVFNPCDKPSNFAEENEETRTAIEYHKDSRNYEAVAATMKPICSVDLRMVDVAHFIIMNIDMDVHLCGSYHEAFLALSQRKPVLIRCKQGKHNAPNWMFGVVPHDLIFSDWEELLEYLNEVNCSESEVDHLNRWRFFDFDKVYGINDELAGKRS